MIKVSCRSARLLDVVGIEHFFISVSFSYFKIMISQNSMSGLKFFSGSTSSRGGYLEQVNVQALGYLKFLTIFAFGNVSRTLPALPDKLGHGNNFLGVADAIDPLKLAGQVHQLRSLFSLGHSWRG